MRPDINFEIERERERERKKERKKIGVAISKRNHDASKTI